MVAPIALQLYTLRDALADDFGSVVRGLVEIGFLGVEMDAFPLEVTDQYASHLFRDLGLQVVAVHTLFPLRGHLEELIERATAYDCSRLVSAYLPPELFHREEKVVAHCERLNEAAAFAAEHGLSLGVHNHWWEFEPVGDTGRTGWHLLQQHLHPDIFFEIDVYWSQAAGHDPRTVVSDLGERAPLLHVKDGPATIDGDHLALGDGALDIPGITAAGGDTTEWLIVELDKCATDIMEAVAASYRYLVGTGLAQGR